MTNRLSTANVTHTRRAVGWPKTGGQGEDATTAHTTMTGTPMVEGDDSTERDLRESKWTLRDGFTSQGTDGVTASGSVHRTRS